MAYGVENISCVYSIVNPIGDIYIGSTRNLCNRIKHYGNKSSHKQKELFKSILQYGWNNHVVKPIMEFDKLATKRSMIFWESWYWMKYKSEGLTMLNCVRPGCSPSLGRKRSLEEIEKTSGANNGMYGKTHSEKEKQKRRDRFTGEGNPMYGKSGSLSPNHIRVVNKETGIIYDSILEAAKASEYKKNSLAMKLRGYRKNNTQFQYLN